MPNESTPEGTTSYVLAKIGRHERMQALTETGTVYMPPLSSYLKVPDPAVGDPDEGLHSRYSSDNPTLRVMAKVGDREIHLAGASISLASAARDHGVYCMYGITFSGGPETDFGPTLRAIAADQRIRALGDTLVLFRDTPEFVRRLELAARTAGHELDQGPIEYVSSSHCGDMGPFRKLDRYSYQNECRFLTRVPIEQPLVLQLGCLLDIANWVNLNDP